MYILSEFFLHCGRPTFLKAALKPGNTGQTAPRNVVAVKQRNIFLWVFIFLCDKNSAPTSESREVPGQ